MLESLFNKVSGLSHAILFKRDSSKGFFLLISPNFIEHIILKNICEQLLLDVFPVDFEEIFPCMESSYR